ncbi:uncharacterized protein LOC131230583 [Magnolia sinica]|uniref:uncharacterized protein LOC131230583 n=1 Tax=Magnolia sinica TaxID=86752 RepID=UPI00265A1A8F|nr:uncharacterized protein LOC131230583 [Magnolia sinica]
MGNPGPSGGGGICRNDNGTFLFGFSMGYGVGSNNMAKLRTIHDGMLICLEKGFDRVIVESDSKLAIHSLSNQSKTPWKWDSWLSRINRLRSLGTFVFTHILREGSEPANGLAREESLLLQSSIYLHYRCLPPIVQGSFSICYLPQGGT